MKEPEFLTLAEVVDLHRRLIDEYGGPPGIRDLGLLEGALAIPQATLGGQYLHGSVLDMAAACLYHLCRDHPFVDGNKRTALAATLVFLSLNGIDTEGIDEETLYILTTRAASGEATKSMISEELARLHAARK